MDFIGKETRALFERFIDRIPEISPEQLERLITALEAVGRLGTTGIGVTINGLELGPRMAP